MLAEVLKAANPSKGEVFVDATFGAGGYSRGLLESGCKHIIAFDQDSSAEKYFLELNEKHPGSSTFVNDNFSNINTHIKDDVDGFVFDIGVSSMQIDQADRGFSFNKDGALDMRMNTSNPLTAEYVVNNYEEEQLANLIFNYGGERKSRRIARYIVEQRATAPFKTTLELAATIAKAVGRYKDEIHPATRSFQAIRIEVNGELKALEEGLKAAVSRVKIGGRVVVVTFHSLEDAIVKSYFAKICGAIPNSNRHLPEAPQAQEAIKFALINRKAIAPSNEEVSSNPRSRSAKLRAIKRVA